VPSKPAAVEAKAVSGDAAAARARCKEIAAGRRQKELLSVCSEAFAADPSAADVAVILAKAEFDRGRAAEAMAWSQKALTADPNAAEAYVFIGGVEQSAGHKKAAKDAYKRYLQLAPGGRYAADLRAIVGTL
jgi:tetratricopeptide (TPR) repeat protein